MLKTEKHPYLVVPKCSDATVASSDPLNAIVCLSVIYTRKSFAEWVISDEYALLQVPRKAFKKLKVTM